MEKVAAAADRQTSFTLPDPSDGHGAVRLAGNDDQVSGCMSVRRKNKKMEKVAAAADRQTSFTLPAAAEVFDRRKIFCAKMLKTEMETWR